MPSARGRPATPAGPLAGSRTDAVVLDEVRYAYPHAPRPAVDGISLRVGRGEIVGLLGPSGAGKTTTQRVVLGLLRDFAGVVDVLGRPVISWGPALYERVGVGFELPANHRRLTARENLSLFAALQPTPREPLALLERLGLGDVADHRVETYSKGMQMRLNLARALLGTPDLLVLDEPTSGLDPTHAGQVLDLIAEERDRGATVLLSTHDMAVADARCDRVAFIVEGRLAAVDTPLALKLRAGPRQVRVTTRDSGGELTSHSFDLAGLGEDQGFLALLRGGAVETIHTTEATLADVFVAVTGQHLR